ncbi:MAG: sigma factor-like helix-turn-helix DNA-binding protein [archaeon]
MGINYITYHKNYKKYNPSVYYSIENFSDDENNDFKQDSNYNLIDKNYKYPEKKVIQKEFFNKLLSSGFTLLERKIILLYYYDKCTMREISDTLDISESRICQICKNVLSRLKNKIKRNPFYFKEYLK